MREGDPHVQDGTTRARLRSQRRAPRLDRASRGFPARPPPPRVPGLRCHHRRASPGETQVADVADEAGAQDVVPDRGAHRRPSRSPSHVGTAQRTLGAVTKDRQHGGFPPIRFGRKLQEARSWFPQPLAIPNAHDSLGANIAATLWGASAPKNRARLRPEASAISALRGNRVRSYAASAAFMLSGEAMIARASSAPS